MIDTFKTPEDIRIFASRRVSKQEYNWNPDVARREFIKSVVEMASHRLAESKIKEYEYDFSKEYRLEVYVASPEQFWELVNREAERIALRFGAPDAGG